MKQSDHQQHATGTKLRWYYPGDESACDSCPGQFSDTRGGHPILSCRTFGYSRTLLHWNCMKEQIGEE